MEKVTGIGGVFFKSKDRKALMEWYGQHLGLEPDGEWGKFFGWREADQPEVLGGTVWSAFPDNTQYFGSGPQSWMINYRVENLDAMLVQLRTAGIEVDGPQDTPEGRFAWAVDSEGNRFELWEPAKQVS